MQLPRTDASMGWPAPPVLTSEQVVAAQTIAECLQGVHERCILINDLIVSHRLPMLPLPCSYLDGIAERVDRMLADREVAPSK